MNDEAGEAMEMSIPELRELELEPSADFVARVRRRIHRRKAHSDLAAFSWHLPKMILVEMAGILGHTFRVVDGRRDSRP